MECPVCGVYMDYTGIRDGLGDYGTSECEVWFCPECNEEWTGNCVEYDSDFQQDYTDGKDFEDHYPPEDDPNHIVNMGDIPF